MKFNARDVIYYPYLSNDAPEAASQTSGKFFLETICSHVVVPVKAKDKDGKEYVYLSISPMTGVDLNDENLGGKVGGITMDYIGEVEIDARKVGELIRQYQCRHTAPSSGKKCISVVSNGFSMSLWTPVDFATIKPLDVFREECDAIDPVQGDSFQTSRLWVVASLKHKACISEKMFGEVVHSEVEYTLDNISEPGYLTHLKEKKMLKYFEDFDQSKCLIWGKFFPVWRVKLTL
jgi:hypothetical protein